MERIKIQNLKDTRDKLVEFKSTLAKLKEQFEIDNEVTINSIKYLQELEAEHKDKIEEEAYEEFKKTGNKKLLGGIGIRVSNTLDYSNEDAMVWVKKEMPIALIITESIDNKQFEAYAKEHELDFVTKEEKIKVTFPKEIKLEEKPENQEIDKRNEEAERRTESNK